MGHFVSHHSMCHSSHQWWSVSATQWGYPRIRGIPAPAVWLKGSPPHCADTHSRLPIIYNGAHNPHEWRPPPDCSEWLPVREPHTATTRQCGTPSLGARASCRSQEQLPHLASAARVQETWSACSLCSTLTLLLLSSKNTILKCLWKV